MPEDGDGVRDVEDPVAVGVPAPGWEGAVEEDREEAPGARTAASTRPSPS